MIYIIYTVIIFIATFLGSTAGLGGGVIIKPALDFIKLHDLQTISLISSFAVLTMSFCSMIKQIKYKVHLNITLILLISLGSILGGFIGNKIFNYFLNHIGETSLNIIQASILIILLIVVLINTYSNLSPIKVENRLITFLIGLMLGTISNFLNIGGGPINVAAYVFFFSLDMKLATIYSIATILFSQISNLISIYFNTGYSNFDFKLLLLIIPTSVIGSFLGTKLNRIANEITIKKIFSAT